MDIFRSLLSIDDSLIDWIVKASPTNPSNPDPAEVQAMQSALAAKSDVEKALDSLIAYRLKLSAAALADDTTKLDQLATDLATVDRDIATAQNVLNIAGQAISIAASVIAKVVTF